MESGEYNTPLSTFLGALMREFRPDPFVMLIGQLERNYGYLATRGQLEDRIKWAIKHCRDLHAEATKYGLAMTAAAAMTSAEQLEDPHIQHNLEGIPPHLRRIVTYEMQALSYFEIPREQIHYWADLDPFGKNVTEQFPSAADDIEEASKCIALGRWTASAFHSLRTQELAINSIYRALTGADLPKEHERKWGSVLKKIRNVLDSWSKSNDRKRWTSPMESAYAFLNNAKGLWRDDTMHVGPKRDDKEALRIFDSTRILMQHLAEWINEEGLFHENK